MGGVRDARALSITLEFSRSEAAGDPFAFRSGRQRYILRRDGGGRAELTIDWDRELLTALQQLGAGASSASEVQAFGERLRALLEPAGWREHARAIEEALRANRPARVTIRSSAAELYLLPWELMTLDRGSGRCLGALAGVQVASEWPETESAPLEPATPPEGGRVLFAWSAAGGAVPAEEQLEALIEASAGTPYFDPERDVVPNVSLADLRAALERGPPVSALHLLCHGGRDGDATGLLLDAETAAKSGVHAPASPALVEGMRLRQLLAPYLGSLRVVVLMACRSGDSGAAGDPLGGVAQALHRAGVQAVVSSRFPLSADGSTAATATLYEELLGAPRSLERALLGARTRLFEETSSLDWASLQLYARAGEGEAWPITRRPYRGLRSFRAEHSALFFGRERESDELVSDLQALAEAGRPRLLIVAGASGTGKSSIVFAGAVPKMLDRPDPPLLVALRPGDDPTRALERALADAASAAGDDADARARLIVVDQFEELFTHTREPAQRQRFVRRLWALASAADGRHSVVVTLRVDFIGRCDELVLRGGPEALRLDQVAYDEPHRVFIARMGAAQLRAAIEEPARVLGLALEPGLVSRILEDVEGEPAALVLVQDTLDTLWRRRRGVTLTQASYDEVGGVTGALRKRADELLTSLDPPQVRVARRLLVRLVDVSRGYGRDTRRRITVEAARPEPAEERARFDAVLERLVDAQLLAYTEEHERAMIELAHEALIRHWEQLTTWVERDRDMLAELAQLDAWLQPWRDHGTLLTGDQLGYGNEVAARYPEELTADARALLGESNARAARRARQRLGLLIGAGVAAALFAITAGLGIWNWRLAESRRREVVLERVKAIAERDAARQARAEAERERERAQREKRRTVDALRLRAAQKALDADRVALAIGFAREVDDATLQGWREIVSLALDRGYWFLDSIVFDAAVMRVAFTADGAQLVTAAAGHPIEVWDARTLERRFELAGTTNLRGAAFAMASDDRVFVQQRDDKPALWDLRARARVLELPPQPTLKAVGLSPDARRAVTAHEDGLLKVWDLEAGAVETQLEGVEDVTDIEFSPTGDRFFVSGAEVARLWYVDDFHSWPFNLGTAGVVADATFPEQGEMLVTASSFRGALKWWTRSGQSVRSYDRGIVGTAVSLGPDDEPLVVGSSDGVAAVWGYRSGESITTLSGHTQFITSVAQSPDGTRIATSSLDGSVRLWRAPRGVEKRAARTHDNLITGMVLVDDASLLVSSPESLALFDTQRTAVTRRIRTPRMSTTLIRGPGGRVAFGTERGRVYLWDAARERELEVSVEASKGRVHRVAYSAASSRLAVLGEPDRVTVWDPAGAGRGDGPLVTYDDDHGVYAIGWNPAGTELIIAGERVTVVDARSGEARHLVSDEQQLYLNAEFLDDGRALLLTPDRDDVIVDARSGATLQTLPGTRGSSGAVERSSAGLLALAAAGGGGALSIWDMTTGTRKRTLRTHEGTLQAHVFSDDGARLATASSDGEVKVWDVATGELIAAYAGHEGPVGALAFTSSGARLFSGGVDGFVASYKLEARRRRDFSAELWAATPICPSARERVELMGQREQDARRDEARCRAVIACVKSGRSSETCREGQPSGVQP